MKALAFVAGVSVGAVATVGVIIGTTLIGVNKITNGAVGEVFTTACADIKAALRGEERAVKSCDSHSDS